MRCHGDVDVDSAPLSLPSRASPCLGKRPAHLNLTLPFSLHKRKRQTSNVKRPSWFQTKALKQTYGELLGVFSDILSHKGLLRLCLENTELHRRLPARTESAVRSMYLAWRLELPLSGVYSLRDIRYSPPYKTLAYAEKGVFQCQAILERANITLQGWWGMSWPYAKRRGILLQYPWYHCSSAEDLLEMLEIPMQPFFCERSSVVSPLAVRRFSGGCPGRSFYPREVYQLYLLAWQALWNVDSMETLQCCYYLHHVACHTTDTLGCLNVECQPWTFVLVHWVDTQDSLVTSSGETVTPKRSIEFETHLASDLGGME